MVLVSNEWLKGDEVQKSTGSTESNTNETTGLATSTVTTTITSVTETDTTIPISIVSTNTLEGGLNTFASIEETINLQQPSAIAGATTDSALSCSQVLSKGNPSEKYSEVCKKGPKNRVIVGSVKNLGGRSNETNANSEQIEIETEKSHLAGVVVSPPTQHTLPKDHTDNLNCNSNSNSNNHPAANSSLLNTFDTITKAFRGSEHSFQVTSATIDFSPALSCASTSLNIDNLGNATCSGGDTETSGFITNRTSSPPNTGSTSSSSGGSTKRPILHNSSVLAGLESSEANLLNTSFLGSLGMGVATNMQSQQQTVLASPKVFSSSLSNLSIGGSAPVTPNNNSLINNNNNNNVNFNNNSNNNGTNNNTILSTSNASAASTYTIAADDNSNQAKIVLICESNSHPFQTRTISLTPNIECKVGRLIARTKANETNAIFDCKVLSRNHAVLWYSDGKFWVKDTKSSNGTFINDNKLGNDAAELHFGDVVKFGVDVYENSRQESHGCIIASVKLYLPDGREAISIDGHSSRSSASAEGRISFEEMHRLNMYMQEAAQREKGLKTKLCSIQNVLDTTRKNSALCWQAMINEDQLIHRINSLEKKLQIMEKNVPESTLRNEVLKLIDDKNAYQVTAKEALRKVYQERCDALQMLAKVESAYATAESECVLLKEEIATTKQTMQEIHNRLLQMDAEYTDYKDEVSRQQSEAKIQEEELLKSLKEQIKQRELECDNLQKEVLHLQGIIAASSSANNNKLNKKDENCEDDQEVLEKQAIENLDAAIGSFTDFGESDDNDNDDDDDDEDDEDADNEDNPSPKEDELDALTCLEKAVNESGTCNGSSDKKKKKSKRREKDIKQKVIKKSTVMKWLKNSDLNKEKGSVDIFKAMFNDGDSNDEEDDIETKSEDHDQSEEDNKNVIGAGAKNLSTTDFRDYDLKYKKFSNLMEDVTLRLDKMFEDLMMEDQLKRERKELNDKIDDGIEYQHDKQVDEVHVTAATAMIHQTNKIASLIENINDNVGEGEAELEDAEDEFIIKRTDKDNDDGDYDAGATTTTTQTANKANQLKDSNPKQKLILIKHNENLLKLKESLESLREACNDLDSAVRPGKIILEKQFTLKPSTTEGNSSDDLGIFDLQRDGDDSENSRDKSSRSMSSYQSGRFSCASSHDSPNTKPLKNNLNEENILQYKNIDEEDLRKHYEHEIKGMQEQIEDMRSRMLQSETDANHTLEIMQIECDTYKMKLNEMTKTIEKLSDEKQELEDVLSEHNITVMSNISASAGKIGNKLGPMALSNASSTTLKASSSICDVPHNINVTSKEVTFDKAMFGSTDGGSSSDIGIESDIGGITTSSASDLFSSRTDSKFEAELAEDRIAALALEREEELIVFKERLEKEQQANHNLLLQLENYKKKRSDQVQQIVVRNIVPLGVIAIAALVYFVTQYI